MGKGSATSLDATNDSESEKLFPLPVVMNIETAVALAAELKQLPLAGKTQLVLDAANVEVITTPGVQIILSLEKTLAAQGGSLKISSRREAFNNALRDIGLERLLA